MNKKELQEKFPTIESIVKEVNKYIGRTFDSIDVHNRLADNRNKGRLGEIIEEGIFGYSINPKPAADFEYLDTELKTTGVIKSKKKGYRAKERLAICNINYHDIINESFLNSHVYKKIKHLLLVLYVYNDDKNYSKFPILKAIEFDIPKEDLKVIEQDYNKIREIVLEGKAEHLSESLTHYLGACTAGEGHGKGVSQPFSDVKAKPRKFSLKNSYLNFIIDEFINKQKSPDIDFEESNISRNIEDYIIYQLNEYRRCESSEIIKKINAEINGNSKQFYANLMKEVFKKKFNVKNADRIGQFVKGDIEMKTLRVERNGEIKESLSFPAFRFEDVLFEEYYESEFYNIIMNKKFLFNVFKNFGGNDYIYVGSFFFKLPFIEADKNFQIVYKKTRKVIKSGKIFKEYKVNKNGEIMRLNYFPKATENEMFHVRPHGQDSKDVYPLPVEEVTLKVKEYTKQCFWINNSYIKMIVNEFIDSLVVI